MLRDLRRRTTGLWRASSRRIGEPLEGLLGAFRADPVLVALALSFVAFVTCSFLALEGWRTWNGRAAAVHAAAVDTANLTRSVLENAEDTIEMAADTLAVLVDRFAAYGITEAQLERTRSYLAAAQLRSSRISSFWVFDVAGNPLVSTRAEQVAASLNVADREYFDFHRSHPGEAPHIGTPFRSRIGGQWRVPVSRRIDRPDGSFAGVALATIDLDYFLGFYRSFDVGGDGVIALHRSDGIILARRPHRDENVGANVAAGAMFSRYLPQEPTGTYEITARLDGHDRIVSYRRSQRYPIVASVALAKAEVLAGWKADTKIRLAVLAALTIVAAGLGVWLFRQIGSRLRAERAAEEAARAAAKAAAHYQLLADNSTDMIVRLGFDGVRRYVSPGSRHLLGWNPEELTGAWSLDLVHPEERAAVIAEWRRIERGEISETTSTYRMRDRDGRYVWCETTFRSVRDPVTGAPTELVAVVRDVTRRRQDEARLRDTVAKLAEASRAAGEANRAKSEFLTAMSHELRTPMNGILGFGQLLDGEHFGALNARQKEHVRLILESGQHLLHLIDDVLDLSKIEAGRVSFTIEPVSIVPLMKAVAATLAGPAETHGIQISLGDFGLGLPEVRADRTRLAQALINLGSNAIKYNRARGRVSFSYERPAEGWVRFVVVDTGIGIPTERQPELFQPFNRLGAEQRGIEGTGIGLTLTRHLVDLMGGRLGFSSTPGIGSRFWIDLPACAPAAAAEAAAADRAALSDQHSSGYSVLYIEDNPSNRALMRDILATVEGTRLVEAVDGAEGLAFARLEHPDVVILDINLPDMDGYAVLQELRRQPETARTPVLALSANAMPDDLRRGRDAGFFGYITKPLDINRLLETIDAAVAERANPTGSAAA